jgi:hypothetical protein
MQAMCFIFSSKLLSFSLTSSSHRPTLLLSNLSSSLSPAPPSHPHSLQLFFFSFSSFTLSPSSLSLSLENPNKPFSHSLSLSDDLLRSHRLPRDCLSADSLSGHARLHANAIGISLSLHLSLITSISHFFLTLPEIEIGF